MNYEQVKAEYYSLLKMAFKYAPDQVGSAIYAEKLGELEDTYPEFVAAIEEEMMDGAA